MTNLTEQWKKGELEAGWYYVLLFSNEEYIAFIDGNWVVDDRLVGPDITEVLSPVPSYEEWLENESHCAVYSDINKWLKQENQQLKEENTQLRKFLEEFNALDVAKENKRLKTLLKEWIHFYPIILYEHEDTLKTRDIVELYEKTREVLKCKK